MRVLVVNHSVENCGVYQYGKRIGDILSNSETCQFIYMEIETFDALLEAITKVAPRCIIFNHLSGTMPWLNQDNIEFIKQKSIKTFTIVHNVGYAKFFDGYFHQDPNFIGDGFRNFPIPRPIFEDFQPESRLDLDILHIGSFGFGFKVKHFDDICKLVHKQFKDRLVQINLHITESFYSPNVEEIQKIENSCRSILKSKNHTLVVTRKFLSNNEILQFLSRNHLNIFLYEKYKTYNGISSTLDYALSVRRPFAINKSNMFSHFHDVHPSICIEDMSLREILENGLVPLNRKYMEWSNENFISAFESVILANSN